MRKFFFSLSAFLLFVGLGCSQAPPGILPQNSATTAKRLAELSEKMVYYLEEISLDSLKIPRALEADGSLMGTNSRKWTSGFFPGTLWQLYGYSKNPKLKTAATQWTAFVEKEKWDTHTHDLGFKVYCSFGKGYQITGDSLYKNTIVQAAKTLCQRYNEKVGAIRSWDWNADVWEFPVIIDNMMNLELLFEATRLTGDSTFYQIAYQHAQTTLKNHFRPDYSSFHVIDYDTLSGDVRLRQTHQGYSHESAWARGQAWGLYGFAFAYGQTKDPAFLAQAQQIAQFFFHHKNLPADKIPYWDFDAPNIPNEPRDVSAAAIAASGLLQLCEYDPAQKKQYLKWVDTILTSLTQTEYQTRVAPFLLDHSTGSVPGNFEVDVPISYADFYYVEALLKRRSIHD